MAKGVKTVYFCTSCGYESAKWAGQCPSCKAWNTFVQETVKKETGAAKARQGQPARPVPLDAIEKTEDERILSGIAEFDRVLGGGVVKGSLTLLGGDPGIGKSTLLLQVFQKLSEREGKALYISGEESLAQIKLRAERLGTFTSRLLLLCETSLDAIEETIRREKPDFVVIDSIQTMASEELASPPGSVSQVREATSVFMQLAKGMGISVFIVGHVTKEGAVAGPKVLEHMVDTVLYFEGEKSAAYRILRSVKNRFGSTQEIGVFEMGGGGLVQVKNPSEYMLQGRSENAAGSVIACSLEGKRPILIEIQALLVRTNFGFPKRTAAGCDYNRVNLLMAVLEKRAGLVLSDQDAYVNLAGGIRLQEPALDLGMVMAVASSFLNKAFPADWMVFGEVGLSGEVRAVSLPALRVAEAKRLGFTACVLPEVSLSAVKGTGEGMQLFGVASVKDALALIRG